MEQQTMRPELTGIFDIIKKALPTIGKVAMGAINAVVGTNGVEPETAVLKVSLGKNENGEEQSLHFTQQNGRLYAVNTSLTQSCTINMPCKGRELPGVQIHMAPFSKYDVTDDFKRAAKVNATRFSIVNSPTSLAQQQANGGYGVLSCLGYFTKALLSNPFAINGHVMLQAVGNNLKITLTGGIDIQCGQNISLRTTAGGAEKNFSKVSATVSETAANDGNSTKCIILEDALDGFEATDELEFLGDIVFMNAEGKTLKLKLATSMHQYDE